MRRVALISVVLLLAIAVVPAAAAPALDVEIEVPATFDPGVDPFTASGPAVAEGLMCPSGFSSNLSVDVKNPESTTIQFLRVLKLFDCAAAGDSLMILLDVRLDVQSGNTTGNWRVDGGTGNYANIRGKGTLVGTPGDGFILDVYSGQLRAGSCVDDVFEPNNSLEAAYLIAGLIDGQGVAFPGSVCGNSDWFEVQVFDFLPCGPSNASEFFSIEVSLGFAHAAGDLELELWDADKQLIARSDGFTDVEEILTSWVGTVDGDDSRHLFVRVSGVLGANNDYYLDIGPFTETCV